MRLPNGYGCIRKLTGKRRRPFHVSKLIGYRTDDKTRKETPVYVNIGYAATRADALQLLAEYNKAPFDTSKKAVTFKQVFDEWFAAKSNSLSDSRKSGIKSTIKYFAPIYHREFNSLKTRDFEVLVDDVPRTLKMIARTIINQIYNYALRYEYCEKDYSRLIQFEIDTTTKTEKKILTPEEIKQIMKDNSPEADAVLLTIYSGIRPAELTMIKTADVFLKERYFVTGVKTENGKNRIVPIHKDIYSRIEKAYMTAVKNHQKTLFISKNTNKRYQAKSYTTAFKSICNGHVPYDARHTFITYAKKSGINEYILKRIVGHSIADLTERVYTHPEISDLVSEMDKVTFD